MIRLYYHSHNSFNTFTNPTLHSMDLQYLSGTIFIMVASLIYVAFCKKRCSHQKLPPGPMKLPIIGNLHNLAGSLPHHTLRELSRRYGPLMHLQLGEVAAIVVSSPSMAREVMKTHDLSFAQRPQLMATKIAAYDDIDVAFAPYGEYWKQMKRICITELLCPKRVQALSFIRDVEVNNLVEYVRSSSSSSSSASSLINLTERLFQLMCAITCRSAFGDKCEDEAVLISALREGSLLAGDFDLADVFPSKKILQKMSRMRPKLEKIHETSDEILQTIVDKHISRCKSFQVDGPGNYEGLVGVLVRLQQSHSLEIPITSENIKAVACDMFTAGTDTAAKTVEWAIAEMMKNPTVMGKAQSDVRNMLKGNKTICEKEIINGLSYLKLVIKETLRLHPPAPLLLPKECREACAVAGCEIPVKTKLIVNAWAIGRDPEYWGKDAEIFRPERFANNGIDFKGTNFEYIPFGAGRRICPGIFFAVANVELALAQLLYHFDWELPSGVKREDLDMSEAFGATVGRKRDLYLKAIPFKAI